MEKIWLAQGDFAVEVWSLGACVNDIRMPDREGRVESVLLGYDTEEDRRAGTGYLGEICGPVANRIGPGGYVIDGQTYTPELNDQGFATLHSGSHGWSANEWRIDSTPQIADPRSVCLRLDWRDPDGGFAGPVHAQVVYEVAMCEPRPPGPDRESDGPAACWALTHTVEVQTEVPTVVNIASHPYFNLSGAATPIDDHRLTVTAGHYLPIDEHSLPRPDAPAPRAGSPFDVDGSTADLGEVLASQDPQMRAHGGIDHAMILDGAPGPDGLRPAAHLWHTTSGRALSIHTDYPALQVYTGQFLSDTRVTHPLGAGGPRTGIALETEEYPDAPRRGDFPSVLLRPGQTYVRRTRWEFSVRL
ncbi:MAG: galactose mutarotase [Propionibacteriaceae bacterium]|nr:galactose mutarotase [Propionibacteriaceae bacterium]